MKEIRLPTGAVLKIGDSPFAVANDLYKSLLAELRSINISPSTDKGSLFKELFTAGFTSSAVEACVWKCLERCTYNDGCGDLKIDSDTFEPVKRRADYMTVLLEVAKENVSPFMKALFAHYKDAMNMLGKDQESK